MTEPLQPVRSSREPVSRRGFVAGIAAGASAAAGVFSIVPRRVLGGPGHVPPSERINIGAIGVGGQGTEDLKEVLADPRAQVVAVCDVRQSCDYSAFYYGGVRGREPARELVNATYAKRDGVGAYAGCEAFVEFGEMLDKADVDAVTIGTPDHMHAIPAMAAIRKGKHVYCQKPLTYTVREARALAAAASEHSVVTQMGNQGHASDRIKQLVEMLQAGAIGQVREIHCWAAATFGGLPRPKETPPVPEGFDWDKWIGPAPFRPYHPAYAPFEWRSWRDFGTGNLGDFGCHIMDPAMWAVGFPKTMTIEASSSPLNEDSWAAANTVRYQFESPQFGGPVTLTWYDGGLKPFRPAAIAEAGELPPSGGMYIGDEGAIVTAHGGDTTLFPERRRAEFGSPQQILPRGETHYEEWVRACRGGAAPLSNFAYAGPLTEMVLLGNVALQTGKAIDWDSDRFEITNLPDANRLLHREYREGWTL
jgi:predicted dehydrogenase